MTEELIPKGMGFQPVLWTERFLCAFISHAEQYAYGKITVIKRHLTSSEVFVLLRGSATLLTADPELSCRKITELEEGKAFGVEAGTWHYLAVSEDALIFVTENNDISAENSETLILEKPWELNRGRTALHGKGIPQFGHM